MMTETNLFSFAKIGKAIQILEVGLPVHVTMPLGASIFLLQQHCGAIPVGWQCQVTEIWLAGTT